MLEEEDENYTIYMTNKLEEESGKWNFEINYDKRQYMAIGNTAVDLEVDNDSMKQTNEYEYLGITLTNTASNETRLRLSFRGRVGFPVY